MKSVVFLVFLALGSAVSATGFAGAPPPAKPVASTVYSGRWFEIAHTPNFNEIDCQAGSFTFTGWASGDFVVIQTCHRGAATGPVKTSTGKARILAGSRNARFRMSLLGGLIHQEYWILDHADDDLWVIMATPGGHFVWLVSRRPTLEAATRAVALARVKALGYDLGRLVFPQQSTH